MLAIKIIQEIQQLPLDKKFWIVEETIKSIKQEEVSNHLALAANELYADYIQDSELTIFTKLDLEKFYEAK